MFSPMNPAFLRGLTVQAPERIPAEGNLGRWQEAARIPCDPPPPEAPELTAGEPNQLQPVKATPQAQKGALTDARVRRIANHHTSPNLAPASGTRHRRR